MIDKRRQNSLALISIVLLLIGAGCSGCQTTLDPNGVYKGNELLYQVDSTLNTAYASMDTFLKWEYDNRAVFASIPEVKAAADHIRANGQRWLNTAFALRDAYEANPTEENRANLNRILTTIRTALLEAAKYMATPAPTNP